MFDTKRKDLAKTFVASSDEVETPTEQPAETSGDENVDNVQPTEQPDTERKDDYKKINSYRRLPPRLKKEVDKVMSFAQDRRGQRRCT